MEEYNFTAELWWKVMHQWNRCTCIFIVPLSKAHGGISALENFHCPWCTGIGNEKLDIIGLKEVGANPGSDQVFASEVSTKVVFAKKLFWTVYYGNKT